MRLQALAPIKKAYLAIRAEADRIRWKLAYQSIHERPGCPAVLPTAPEGQLLLVPHADDELLGAYALIRRERKKLILAYYGFTGSNHSEDNRKRRDAEFLRFCSETGTEHTRIDSSHTLCQLLSERSIRTVYVPSLVDWHPEHRKLNYELHAALAGAMADGCAPEELNITWYSVTVPIEDANAVIVPMTKEEQDEKYRLFREIYLSQAHMPLERFALQERINAKGTVHHCGEVYLPLSMRQWKQMTEKAMEIERNGNEVSKLSALSGRINDIKVIRSEASGLYQFLRKEL